MALEITEAIETARRYLTQIVPDAALGDPRMEEIERDDGKWVVTFSFLPSGRSAVGSNLIGPRSPFGVGRTAKVVVVNGVTGDFVALKQRAA